jgi:hypothetical protein
MVIKMDIRKVERRFIDVRNPDHTIKKVVGEYQDETPEEVEARLTEQRGNPPPYDKDFKRTMGDCPICRGSGMINREQAVNVRFEGDGALPPEQCYACNGSGKYEDYLKWEKKQDDGTNITRRREEPYNPNIEDDWVEH